jgi:hypothetical protein
MTSSEHMYVLSAAQSDEATDLTELEIKEDDLRDFRRRFKAARKKIRKNNSMANEVMVRHTMTTSREVEEKS